MGKLADAAGVGPEFTFRGKVYQSVQATFKHRGMFEAYLERRAWEVVQRSKSYCTPIEYRENVSIWERDCAAGDYDYGSQAYAKALNSYHGRCHMLLLTLRELNPEVDEKWCVEFMDEQIEEAARVFQGVNGDRPNPGTDGERTVPDAANGVGQPDGAAVVADSPEPAGEG